MAIMKGYGVIEPTVSWGWMEKRSRNPVRSRHFVPLSQSCPVLPMYTAHISETHGRTASWVTKA